MTETPIQRAPELAPGVTDIAVTPVSPLRVVLVLAALTGAGLISAFMYLPSLPTLAAELGTTAQRTQFTLTSFLVGVTLAQLYFGSLSDRIGRMPALVIGTAIYVLASIACALAPDVGVLVAARFVQGIGATAGPVIARAIVRDLFPASRAAQVMAYMSMSLALAPALGPALGAYIHGTFGWRANFVLIAVTATVATIATWRLIGETNRYRGGGRAKGRMLTDFRRLLGSTNFLGFLLCSSLHAASFYAFMAAAPFVLIITLGQTAEAYGRFTLLAFLGYALGAFAVGRLVVRHGVIRTNLYGVPIIMAGAAGLIALALAGVGTVGAILWPTAVLVLGMGFMVPTSTAGAVGAYPEMAGTAASLLGFVQMGLGAAAVAFIGAVGSGSQLALAIVVGGLALLGLAVFPLAMRRMPI